jgi:hypothetical protein
MLVKDASGFATSDRGNLLEVLQRCRRIETRLTRFLETEGIQTGIQRPWWADGKVMIPSPMTTIDAILDCIPEGWSNRVEILLKEDDGFTIICDILV